MFPVNVSPDMSMYNLLKSQGYAPAYALAEFIDNALQAYLSNMKVDENPEPLEILVKFYSLDYPVENLKNSIVIIDNGPGIAKKRLIEAMQPAKPPKNTGGLSEFGIGMKAAAVWFADSWSLITKSASSTKEFEFEFNLTDLIANSESTISVQEVKSDRSTGTQVCLFNLRKPM